VGRPKLRRDCGICYSPGAGARTARRSCAGWTTPRGHARHAGQSSSARSPPQRTLANGLKGTSARKRVPALPSVTVLDDHSRQFSVTRGDQTGVPCARLYRMRSVLYGLARSAVVR